MKREATEHPKMKRFAKAIERPIPYAIGTVELMLHFTEKYCPQGDIGRFSQEDLADALKWDGNPQILEEALISSGWLIRDETHRLILKGWSKHAPDFLQVRLVRSGQRFADGKPAKATKLSQKERSEIAAEYPGAYGHLADDEEFAKRTAAHNGAQRRLPDHTLPTPRVGGSHTRACEAPVIRPTNSPTPLPNKSESESPPGPPASVADLALIKLGELNPRPQWLDDPASVIVARDSIAAAVARHGDAAVREVIALAFNGSKPPEAVAEIRDALARWPNALTPKGGRDRMEIAIEALAIVQGRSPSGVGEGGFKVTKGDFDKMWAIARAVRSRCQGQRDFVIGDPNPAPSDPSWNQALREAGEKYKPKNVSKALWSIVELPDVAQRFAADATVLAAPGFFDALIENSANAKQSRGKKRGSEEHA